MRIPRKKSGICQERNAFLSQESQYPDFKGQTVGQIKQEMEKYKTFLEKEISSIVGSNYFQTYINGLRALREIRSQKIMKERQHLYHFSQAAPEKTGEYLTPKVQERGNAFTENIGENLCYTATNNTSLYILKPPLMNLMSIKILFFQN